jgi:hypothetical protein
MNVPVLIGEWGAYNGESFKLAETAQQVIDLFEVYGFSNTYWAYYDNINEYPYFNMAIVRPYPESISGNLVSYDYNFKTGDFICIWDEKEENEESTVIHVPNLRNLSESDIKMNSSVDQIIFEYCDNSNAGNLYISPLGKNSKRTLRFNILPEKTEEISIK